MSEPSSWNKEEARKLPKVRLPANAWIRIWTQIFGQQSHTVNPYVVVPPYLYLDRASQKFPLLKDISENQPCQTQLRLLSVRYWECGPDIPTAPSLGERDKNVLGSWPGSSVCCPDTSGLRVQSPVAAHKSNQWMNKWNHKSMFLSHYSKNQ